MPKDHQPNRWELLRILDSQMKMAQATANRRAYDKALAEYRRLKGQAQ